MYMQLVGLKDLKAQQPRLPTSYVQAILR